MSSHVPVGEVTAVGAGRKRKDPEPSPVSPPPRAELPAGSRAGRPAPDNRLLAGCLAHEFLTRGTLFGKRREAGVPAADAPAAAESARSRPSSSYAKVSYLLKADGARIPGVINPTQLVRWLEM